MNATPFAFSDFRNPSAAASARSRHEIAALEAEAFERGRQAGFQQAESAAEGRLAAALERLGMLAPSLLAEIDARTGTVEADAVRVALSVAKAIAGEALAAHPLQAVATVAAEAFGHLRGVPHLVIRVHETLVDDVETMTARMGRERGFEGRVVVLGEPDIAAGDARLEWADGGVVRERARLEADIIRVAAEFGLTDQSQRIA